MDEGIKERKERAKKPEIKIALKDYLDLEAYGKGVDKTPVKIVNELVKDFLAKDGVKKIVEENSVNAKAKERIAKKEAKARQMLSEVEEEKKRYGLK